MLSNAYFFARSTNSSKRSMTCNLRLRFWVKIVVSQITQGDQLLPAITSFPSAVVFSDRFPAICRGRMRPAVDCRFMTSIVRLRKVSRITVNGPKLDCMKECAIAAIRAFGRRFVCRCFFGAVTRFTTEARRRPHISQRPPAPQYPITRLKAMKTLKC